jgi:hypothetical protein
MIQKTYLLLWLFWIFIYSCNSDHKQAGSFHQDKDINWLAEPSGQTGQYELFEFEFDLQKEYDNPFDAGEVAVDLIITDGKETLQTVPCFFNEEYAYSNTDQKWIPAGRSSWKARYTPDKPGEYSYFIRIKDQKGITESESRQLIVTSGRNKGFIRAYTSNYLLFDDGSPFFANSFNLCIPPRDRPFDYEYFFRKWKDNRMNYTRLWLAPPWGEYAFALEWTDPQFPSQQGKLGLKRYNQEVAARLDDFMQKAEEYGIYIMLCLGDERELETGIFRNEELPPNRSFWHANPYNRENGGPAASPLEFFILDEAKHLYKNRLRYLIARWGYSTHLIMWEFWNEIDHPKWCQDWTFVQKTVANWHQEMGDYIRKQDPFHHLISTSFAHENNQPLIWTLTEMDVIQAHNYGGSENLATGALRMTAELKRAFPEKPMLISEYGTDFHGYTHEGGAEEIAIHNSIWASALSGATGITHWWWWDDIDEYDLYPHYNHLGIFIEKIPWLECKNLDLKINVPEALAVGLGTEDNAWLWIHNSHHNWDNAKYNRPVNVLSGIQVYLEDLPPGHYRITQFDTYSGQYYPAQEITFTSSPEIVIESLEKDKAYYMEKLD